MRLQALTGAIMLLCAFPTNFAHDRAQNLFSLCCHSGFSLCCVLRASKEQLLARIALELGLADQVLAYARATLAQTPSRATLLRTDLQEIVARSGADTDIF